MNPYLNTNGKNILENRKQKGQLLEWYLGEAKVYKESREPRQKR